MKKLIMQLLNPALFIKVFLGLILLINFPHIGSIVSYLLKIIPFWGMAIVMVNIKKIIKIFMDTQYWLLIMMGCSYLVTIVINRQYYFMQNLKALIWFALYVAVLLVWWKYSDESIEKKFRHIEQINWIVVIMNMLNVIPSIFLLTFNLRMGVPGVTEPVGMAVELGRLFGIVSGVNQSAIVALCSIGASFFAMQLNKALKRKYRCWLWVNIICSYIYIIATGTRAVRYTMIVACAFILLLLYWRKKWHAVAKKNKFVLVLYFMVSIVVIGGGSFAGIEVSRYPIGTIPVIGEYVKTIVLSEDQLGEDQLGEDQLGEDQLSDEQQLLIRNEESKEVSNAHRMNIIQECISLWKEHFWFGTGNANMYVYAETSKENFKYISIAPYGASTHCMPIAVLLYSGLVGAIIFGVYLVQKMWKSLIIVIKQEQKDDKEKNYLLMPYVNCLALCMYSILGTIIIFSNVQGTVLFWVYLGIFDMMMKILKEK